MHIIKTLLIFVAAIAPQIVFAQASADYAVQPSSIDVRRNGEKRYQMVLRSYRSNTVTAGQAELLSKAGELCAPGHAQFGRYSFDLAEPVGGRKEKPIVLVLGQEIDCGMVPSPAQVAPLAAASPTGTPQQVQHVEELTRLYFQAKDQGRYTGAYDLMAASLKDSISFDTWKGKAAAFNAKAGAVKQRTISKITWYRNPPQVEPGLYAAVDFSSKFTGVDLHCGFLAWHEQADGRFVLVREEENYLDKHTQQKLSPDDIEKVRQQFNCK